MPAKRTKQTPRAGRLKIGMYIEKNVGATILNITKCLRNWDMTFVSLRRDELAKLKTGDVDVVILHGGWYDFPEKDPARKALMSYVRSGGGCIGICCGAINICRLGLIQTKAWHRYTLTGWMKMPIQTPKHPIAKGVCNKGEGYMGVPIVYFNGPQMTPSKSSTVMIGSYDAEGRVGAVLADDYGKGRVVAFGPHPEKEQIDELATHNEPLQRCSLLLHNALYWAARRNVPALKWDFPEFVNVHGSLRPVREYRTQPQ